MSLLTQPIPAGVIFSLPIQLSALLHGSEFILTRTDLSDVTFCEYATITNTEYIPSAQGLYTKSVKFWVGNTENKLRIQLTLLSMDICNIHGIELYWRIALYGDFCYSISEFACFLPSAEY